MDSRMNSRSSNDGKNCKHKWTPTEDAALVEALTELCVGGYWKVDNAFRPGYLTQLENKLAQKIENCELRATPHIESRVKTLKRQTLAIYEMICNSSGFAWNDESKMIVCEKRVFDDWLKVHKDAKGLRNKPFPHFDSLMEIFGKDRANGKGAEGPAEAIEDLTTDGDNALNSNTVDLEDIDASTPVTPTPTCPPSKSGGKRKRDGWSQGLGDMASTFQSFVEVTKAHFENMKAVLSNEHATTERRGKIVEELMKIRGLSDADVIDAAAAIIGDDAKIDLLFTLPDNLKVQWVYKLLPN